MCCGLSVITDAHFGTNELRLRMRQTTKRNGVRRYRERVEVFLRMLYKLIVVHSAITNKNHEVSSVICLNVGVPVITVNGKDILLGSKNRPTKGLT